MSAGDNSALRSTSRLDLGVLMAAAEAAPPVDAADAVGAALADMVDALGVSFLIADFSGDSLIRLGHSERDAATRRLGRDTAERVALRGTAHGRALTGQ